MTFMADINDQIGVFVTLQAIFPNEQPDLNLLKRLLQNLNKSEVTSVFSRLNLFVSDRLNEGKGSWIGRHTRKQWEVATNVFRPDRLPRIEAFFKQHPLSVLVFRGQILELIRWAALYSRQGGLSNELATDLDKREAFAKALLTVNSIWENRVYRGQLSDCGDLTSRRLRLLPRFRRSLSETAAGPDMTQAFARGKAIVCDYLCALDPGFASRFRARNQLTLEDYYLCLLYIVLCSMGIWGTAAGINPLAANRFFSPTSDRPDIQRSIERLMELRSQTATELTRALWKDKSQPTEIDILALNHNILRDRPILRLSDSSAIVMDPIFLREMSTMGPLFMSDDTNAALTQFGHAFEAYCRNVLASMYPTIPGLAPRVSASTLGSTASGEQVQLADVILDCGDRTILIETKASLIREDKIESFDRDEYITFLRIKYGISGQQQGGLKKKGVAQLATSISKLARGEWRQAEPRFPIRRQIIPVLLVHDQLIDAPLHPWFLAREFAALLDPSNAGLDAAVMRVQDYFVSNLIVMTIEDLEALESSIQTFGLGDLLHDYGTKCKDRMVSLHNYIVGNRKYGGATVYSNRLREMFEKDLRECGYRLAGC
jgi:hypothetical protein